MLKSWVEYALDLIERDKPSLLAFQGFLDYLTKDVDNKEYFLFLSNCWRAAHSKVASIGLSMRLKSVAR